ncbi:hypothetical protein ACRE_000260 [Hapsidospora chrysogenum ATCC 11550]|uniref:Uncharacterized protein n=1 Tax=Hapsidospora chrysogenum (strain ATCC 11550 / CBS 779.69 / DSM 880 / IAM 14645 / JCM 23072 / IMI 49137) TaxID=857340 RepID=A0A086TI27_HAPC1|nr:hypothetical protein ACRE_000260 [Hapsidospora chrysogenum ATCC 11550]
MSSNPPTCRQAATPPPNGEEPVLDPISSWPADDIPNFDWNTAFVDQLPDNFLVSPPHNLDTWVPGGEQVVAPQPFQDQPSNQHEQDLSGTSGSNQLNPEVPPNQTPQDIPVDDGLNQFSQDFSGNSSSGHFDTGLSLDIDPNQFKPESFENDPSVWFNNELPGGNIAENQVQGQVQDQGAVQASYPSAIPAPPNATSETSSSLVPDIPLDPQLLETFFRNGSTTDESLQAEAAEQTVQNGGTTDASLPPAEAAAQTTARPSCQHPTRSSTNLATQQQQQEQPQQQPQQQSRVPAALSQVGHTLPALLPYCCSTCGHEGYQTNPFAPNYGFPSSARPAQDLAVHNDYSGVVPPNGESRYPDPSVMAENPVPPYGTFNSGAYGGPNQQQLLFQPLPGGHLVAPSTSSVSTSPIDRTRRRPRSPKNPGSHVPQRISHRRKDKRAKRQEANPEKVYKDKPDGPAAWGPPDQRFVYRDDFRLNVSGLSARQLNYFIHNNPREIKLWVQNHPAQCKSRLPDDGLQCLWNLCPGGESKIMHGWLQVSLDEFPDQTSDGTLDPFKDVAGVMHLYCFEQCFDVAALYQEGMLQPETRSFPKEQRNPMNLVRESTDEAIIEEAWHPWFAQHRVGEGRPHLTQPRRYEDSLSHALISYHLGHQIKARAVARDRRNFMKDPSERCTIDIHKGDLKKFARLKGKISDHLVQDDHVPGEENRFQPYVPAQQRVHQQPHQPPQEVPQHQAQVEFLQGFAYETESQPANPQPQQAAPQQGTKRRSEDYGEGEGSPKRRRSSPADEHTRRSPRLAGKDAPAPAQPQNPENMTHILALPG